MQGARVRDARVENAVGIAFNKAMAAFRVTFGQELLRRIAALRQSGGKRRAAARARGAIPAPEQRGAKRTRDQLAATAKAALGVIQARPGIIPEEIAKALGVRSKDLTLPLLVLRQRDLVTWSGQKRFTRYTAR